jgi:hypothetical protein
MPRVIKFGVNGDIVEYPYIPFSVIGRDGDYLFDTRMGRWYVTGKIDVFTPRQHLYVSTEKVPDSIRTTALLMQ